MLHVGIDFLMTVEAYSVIEKNKQTQLGSICGPHESSSLFVMIDFKDNRQFFVLIM